MKSSFLAFFLIVSGFSITAQESVTEENTLENQFDRIYRISTSYQTYKVISKEGYQKLKNNVLDSLNLVENMLSEKVSLLKTKESDIQRLNEKINNTQISLDASIKKENSISLFGLALNKTTYNSILWFLIIVLLMGMLFFMYKFSNSNLLTKEAKHNLAEVEQELSLFRKKNPRE
jgi:ATP-dependent Zn protease